MRSFSETVSPDLWMPAVECVPAWMHTTHGDPFRVVWDTLERPATNHPRAVADYLNRIAEPRHLVWNPTTGEIVQMRPADYTTRIGVIATAERPFTDGPCKGLHEIVEWLTNLGIPQAWPAGPPMRPEVPGNRDLAIWGSTAGHYGSSQVPYGQGTGPGPIDIQRLFDGARLDPAGDRETT